MNGKGSRNRSFSKEFQNNYDDILWSEPKVMDLPTVREPLWRISLKKDGHLQYLYFFGESRESATGLFEKSYPDEVPNFINAELYIE